MLNDKPNDRPGEDQWAQCDDCGSWRKVPSSVFLPTKWVCADNIWDTERLYHFLSSDNLGSFSTFNCKAFSL